MLRNRAHREVISIVAIYAVFGSLWIYFSDSVLSWLVADPRTLTQIEIFKGLLFILCTSALLYLLIHRFHGRIHQSGQAMQQSESLLQTVIQTIPDQIWLKDINGVYLSCNTAFETFLGMDQSEIIGRTAYDFFDAERADYFRDHDRRAFLAGKPHTNEEWISYATDGRLVLLETIRTPMFDRTGVFIGVLGIGRDITERKRLENELRESESIFRLTFDASPDAININRLEDGLYIDINEGFTRATGYTRDDVLGKTSLELNIWNDPAEREVLVKGLRENGYCENLEAQFRKKDGTLLTALMSARMVTIKNVPHIVSITRDISARKLHEDELLKMEKLESLGLLAGGIAHDFNNVLTGIIGNITLARACLDSDHQAAAPLANAEKAARRTGELAHQLLTFARGGEPVKKVLSPRKVIDEALSLALHGSNVRGVAEISEPIDAFEADEGQISQVLHNIIINATQAMPGGGTLLVKAGNMTIADNNSQALPAGPYIRIAVTDHGHGISRENIGKIFDPYFSTKPQGNGLGLATAYSIVTKHGGYIGVKSVAGRGTTISILLPSLGTSYQEHDEASGEAEPSLGKTGGSILVMDDESVVKETAESMLSHLGYRVQTCSDGHEAVQRYRQAAAEGIPFAAVIMDLTIPGGLGGKETAQQILAEFPDARLFVSSGYSQDAIVSQYRDHGFTGVLQKPYSLKEVAAALAVLESK